MSQQHYTIRKAKPTEFDAIGKLMVRVYSDLEGFPTAVQQPDYYQMLSTVGALTDLPQTQLLVAVAADEKIMGAVVYYGDMQYYGSKGTATQAQNTSGFRLLAVDPLGRGKGIGHLLIDACIRKAKDQKHRQLLIHSTMAMPIAWKMYKKRGFLRAEELDFMQGELAVFGFRLLL